MVSPYPSPTALPPHEGFEQRGGHPCAGLLAQPGQPHNDRSWFAGGGRGAPGTAAAGPEAKATESACGPRSGPWSPKTPPWAHVCWSPWTTCCHLLDLRTPRPQGPQALGEEGAQGAERGGWRTKGYQAGPLVCSEAPVPVPHLGTPGGTRF
ncbi:unnamed protein product [Rangifer tarandus platyrhynchus]|uniref:Uncharacterized protein n=2 Tax=Rangifer tarandus platyrhynchus TaxID=3082113 RepID=A0ABN8ZDZ7_RANTA|nr:unnamed protein product [Rangifer tarandus platyrhynchus]CAI9705647.1 unnamed protein product [Rangifer tarandus platyrhynchus]